MPHRPKSVNNYFAYFSYFLEKIPASYGTRRSGASINLFSNVGRFCEAADLLGKSPTHRVGLQRFMSYRRDPLDELRRQHYAGELRRASAVIHDGPNKNTNARHTRSRQQRSLCSWPGTSRYSKSAPSRQPRARYCATTLRVTVTPSATVPLSR